MKSKIINVNHFLINYKNDIAHRAVIGAIFSASVCVAISPKIAMFIVMFFFLTGLTLVTGSLFKTVVSLLASIATTSLITTLAILFNSSIRFNQISMALLLLLNIYSFGYVFRQPFSDCKSFSSSDLIEFLGACFSATLSIIGLIHISQVDALNAAQFVNYEDNDSWLNILGLLNHFGQQFSLNHSSTQFLITSLHTALASVQFVRNGFSDFKLSSSPSILVSQYQFLIVLIPVITATALNRLNKNFSVILKLFFYFLTTFLFLGVLLNLLYSYGSLDSAFGVIGIATALVFSIDQELNQIKFRSSIVVLLAFLAATVWWPLIPVSVVMILQCMFYEFKIFKIKQNNLFDHSLFVCIFSASLFIIYQLGFQQLSHEGLAVFSAAGGVASLTVFERFLYLIIIVLFLSFIVSNVRNREFVIRNSVLIAYVSYIAFVGMYDQIKFGSMFQYSFMKLSYISYPVLITILLIELVNVVGKNKFFFAITSLLTVVSLIANGVLYSSVKGVSNYPQRITNDSVWLPIVNEIVNNTPGARIYCLEKTAPTNAPAWYAYSCQRFSASIVGLDNSISQAWRSTDLGVNNISDDVNYILSAPISSLTFVFIGSQKEALMKNQWYSSIIYSALKMFDKIVVTS